MTGVISPFLEFSTRIHFSERELSHVNKHIALEIPLFLRLSGRYVFLFPSR